MPIAALPDAAITFAAYAPKPSSNGQQEQMMRTRFAEATDHSQARPSSASKPYKETFVVLTGLRVLVVEDEAMLSILLEDFLTDLGCQVVATASHLEDALEKASTLAIDIAVLDINLSGVLSYPVAEVLRSRGIRFLFATGYGTMGLPDDLKGTLALSKPFNQKQLAAAILSTLDA